jgi:hypothetical protein
VLRRLVRLIAVALAVVFDLSVNATAQELNFHYDGIGTGDGLGASASSGFDLDGDAIDDVAIGSPLETGIFSASGVVRIYSGASHTLLQTIDGPSASAQFGASVALVGDLDLDGFGDVVIGAPQDGGIGSVTAWSFHSNTLLWTAYGTAGSELGASLAAAGDLNFDSRLDVVAGAPGADTVYPLNYDGSNILYITGGSGTHYGAAVAGNFDVDGDGGMDIVIGQPLADSGTLTDCGRVSVWNIFKSAKIFANFGSTAGDQLGSSVALLGDVTGDQKSEVLAGAPYAARSGGGVREFDSSGTVRFDVFSINLGDQYGASVCRVADVDLDGFPDIAVGAPGAPAGGAAQVLSGVDGTLLWTFSAPDATSYEAFGSVIASGDVNGDGVGDLLIGDPKHDNVSLIDAGSVDIYTEEPAHWTNYGTGFPGTLGVPSLQGLDNPGINTIFSVSIGNSLGSATLGLLLIGLAPTDFITSAGGHLLVIPTWPAFLSIATSGVNLSGAIPNDLSLLGLHIYMQVIESDPGAAKRISFSTGLDAMIGIDYP